MKRSVVLGLLTLAISGSAHADTGPPSAPSHFVFEEYCTTAPLETLGVTPYGRRLRVGITGGTFSGPGIKGRILPGGADTQLLRNDGSLVIDAAYTLQTDDGVMILIHNVGVLAPAKGPTHPTVAWAAPVFEAPLGRYEWLNSGIFVSSVQPTMDPAHPAVRIRIYKIGSDQPGERER